jgi:hypothetical protein
MDNINAIALLLRAEQRPIFLAEVQAFEKAIAKKAKSLSKSLSRKEKSLATLRTHLAQGTIPNSLEMPSPVKCSTSFSTACPEVVQGFNTRFQDLHSRYASSVLKEMISIIECELKYLARELTQTHLKSCEHLTDILNRALIRSTKGQIFKEGLFTKNIEDTIKYLQTPCATATGVGPLHNLNNTTPQALSEFLTHLAQGQNDITSSTLEVYCTLSLICFHTKKHLQTVALQHDKSSQIDFAAAIREVKKAALQGPADNQAEDMEEDNPYDKNSPIYKLVRQQVQDAVEPFLNRLYSASKNRNRSAHDDSPPLRAHSTRPTSKTSSRFKSQSNRQHKNYSPVDHPQASRHYHSQKQPATRNSSGRKAHTAYYTQYATSQASTQAVRTHRTDSSIQASQASSHEAPTHNRPSASRHHTIDKGDHSTSRGHTSSHASTVAPRRTTSPRGKSTSSIWQTISEAIISEAKDNGSNHSTISSRKGRTIDLTSHSSNSSSGTIRSRESCNTGGSI